MASPSDRSVALAELTARAETAPTKRRARSDCRNPECQNGLTPGLEARGGGNKAQPLFGAGGVGAKKLMRWTWVPCLVCNAPEDARKASAVYRDLRLTEDQIAQRAQMATNKTAYQPALSRPPARPGAGSTAAPSADAGRLNELTKATEALTARLDEALKQNAQMMQTNAEMSQAITRMSIQIAALLEDNAKLRATQPASTTPPSGAT